MAAYISSLKRTLGPGGLIGLGVGCIIGTGIFVLTGTAAASYAGPAIILSFLLAAVACGLTALSYAELAAMLPFAGGAYSYVYSAFGRTIAWFVAWNLILEYLFATATISVGWSAYAVNFLAQLGVSLPVFWTTAPLAGGPDHWGIIATGAVLNIPAMAIVVTVTAVCYFGISLSSKMNMLIVLIKVGILLLFIGAGWVLIDSRNWTPFLPPNTGVFGQFGWSGVMRGAAVVFYTFIGFDAVCTAAQESRNPGRNLPLAIFGSLLVCTILYVLVASVLTGLVRYPLLNVAAPFAVALDMHASLSWMKALIKLGAIAGMTSAILVTLIAQPRIFFAMAQDRLLPQYFGAIHPRYGSPHRATLVTGGVAAAIGGILPIQILGELVSIGTLTVFLFVNLAVLVLRRTDPTRVRPFRVPAASFVCSSGAVVCAILMLSLPLDTWMRLAAWTAVGCIAYLFYSRARPSP